MTQLGSYSTFTVNCSTSAAEIILSKVPDVLTGTAKRLYTALAATALEVMQDRNYSSNTTEVVFFAPAESVALAVGIHPATLYRNLPKLAEAGLVEARGHFCTHNRQTRLDGTVWAVRLSPVWGSKARIGYDWLKKSYRSLGADIEAGRTAWAQTRQSSLKDKSVDINLKYILDFALSKPPKPSLNYDSRAVDLTLIFDPPQVKKQDRSEAIYNAAKAISSSLNDNQSANFYMSVLWNLLRIRDRTGVDYFAALHLMVSRVAAEAAEGGLSSPGALLVSRIKAAGLLEPPN